MEECRKLGRCPTGEARITSGGNLQARFVIHAVGPIYNKGVSGEAQLLANAYRNSLHLAVENNVRSVAFPSISTGIYGYPVRDAAQVALQAVIDFLHREEHQLQTVRFVLFDSKTFETYGTNLRRIGSIEAGG
jgi:O-acetyl-ADP-ribose deacetylase (regulator of RNase III)